MRAAQAGMPIRAASWLIPDATTATLPAIQRDSGTGLLDLRGMENSAPASGQAAGGESRPANPAPAQPRTSDSLSPSTCPMHGRVPIAPTTKRGPPGLDQQRLRKGQARSVAVGLGGRAIHKKQ